jgi:hypothetical protein
MDQLDALGRLLESYEARTGRPAAAWSELIAAGLLRAVPVDPTGRPYRLEGQTAVLDPASRLLPLPNPAQLR